MWFHSGMTWSTLQHNAWLSFIYLLVCLFVCLNYAQPTQHLFFLNCGSWCKFFKSTFKHAMHHQRQYTKYLDIMLSNQNQDCAVNICAQNKERKKEKKNSLLSAMFGPMEHHRIDPSIIEQQGCQCQDLRCGEQPNAGGMSNPTKSYRHSKTGKGQGKQENKTTQDPRPGTINQIQILKKKSLCISSMSQCLSVYSNI